MTQRLTKLNYRDTGFLSNATPEERNKISLSIYYQIGRYDPSNKFVVNYRKKDVLQLYREYTEEKMIITNSLIQIYAYLYTRYRRTNETREREI